MQTFGAYVVAAMLAAGANVASALPQDMDTPSSRSELQQGGTFSVPVYHNKYKRSGAEGHPALAYAQAFHKYNATVPSDLQSVVDKHSLNKRTGGKKSGVAATSAHGDQEFVSTIFVGTPPQQLSVLIDTASSDLWLMGAGSAGTSNHKTYDVGSSSSATLMAGASWSIKYGDGSTSSGTVYNDRVNIGNLSVPHQAVEVASQVSSQFTNSLAYSGIVGMAMSSLNQIKPNPQMTWFDNIKDSLASPLFTVDLKHSSQGSYKFGYIDDAAHTGSIYYSELHYEGILGAYWSFTATSYSVGTSSSTRRSSGGDARDSVPQYGSSSSSLSSESDGLARLARAEAHVEEKKWNVNKPTSTIPEHPSATRAPTTAITGIVDTGTTLLLLPNNVVTAYYAQVPGASMSRKDGGYVFSCDSKLPDFSFTVGGGRITIPGAYMNYMPIGIGSSTCFGGIQSNNGLPVSVFGDIAIKSAFVVFDAGNSRMGWAAKHLS
ncbi:unnamed protein product [Discula destructiva]